MKPHWLLFAGALLLYGAGAALSQPANDNFANAWTLGGVAAATNGTSVGATKEAGEPNHAGYQGGRSVWFNWTAPRTMPIQIDTLGSSYDTVLAVYTGSAVNALTVIASNDDAPGLGTLSSLVQFSALEGTVYRIAIDSFGSGGSGGNYILNIRQVSTVAITSPTSGTVFRLGTPIEVDVGGEVPNPPITRVDFYRGNVLFASDDTPPFSAVATNVPAGFNGLRIVALDSAGLSWTSSVTVRVVSEGVTILSPNDGNSYLSSNPGQLLTNPIPVVTYAWLSSGVITNVEFFVDGQKFAEDNSDPFTQTWTNVTGGSHRLIAVGHSDSGGTYRSPPVNIAINQVFIFRGSVWKYLDNGSNQGTNWVSPSFDDSSWASGPAELGYGDGDEVTVVNGGPVGNRFITTYFRNSFTVTNATNYSFLLIGVKRDDGAVVYLNGREAARFNMNSGPVTYTTVAPEAFDDGTFFDFRTLSTSFLVEGRNVIAVEIHQAAPNSSDISFDMDLAGAPRIIFNSPPTVNLTGPNGVVFVAPPVLTLEATPFDSDGRVTKVEFFVDGVKLGESTNAPYTFDWITPAPGLHTVTVVATDDQEAQGSTSAQIVIYDEVHTPISVISSPANRTVLEGPTNIVVTAYASALDGGVTNVLFFANGSLIGADDSSPYSAVWNAPFGSNWLQALAFGANGLVGTSAVSSIIITIPPTNTVAPFVLRQSPVAFANVTNVLTSMLVQFSERVQNVDASDLLINAVPATGVSGSGSNYIFTFPQPPFGEVEVAWVSGHGITDFGWPTVLPFDEFGPNARWEYHLVDRIPPTIIARSPAAGSTVTNLTQIGVTFSKTVVGVDAADLLVNGTPGYLVAGSGSNYVFGVSQPPSGTVTVSWAVSPSIVDQAEFPNAFNAASANASWSFILDARTVLVQSNSTWQYFKGTSEASSPMDAWRQLGFDVNWPSSLAPFFYGDPYTNTLITGTYLGDMQNNYSSVYFRREFTVPNAAALDRLLLNIQIDDGFIAWVNGTEVARYNMRPGDMPYNTNASTSSFEPLGAGAAYVLFTLTNAVSLLESGRNVLAVHAFNTSIGGGDFGFNAQLFAYVNDAGASAPRVVRTDPAAGIVYSLTNLTITFSEAVNGVDAGDLLVNGVPASIVVSSGTRSYTFDFLQPAYGPVIVTWSTNHGIIDLDDPPKPFDATAASSILRYTLYNPNAPTIAAQTPVAGSVVTGLTAVTVTFSEPVNGMDAADFLVNGVAASAMSSSADNVYTFSFAQPGYGPVSIGWAANHGIRDLDTPPNDFDPSRPGTQWSYTLIDPVPSVTITAPADNAVFLAPANITIQATASDNDGTIARVEFFEGANKLGEATNSPYAITWSNVLAGEYVLQAVATDDSGLMATSAPVSITVVTSLPIALLRGPYLQVGTPTSGIVRWRTDLDSDAAVFYGTDAESLTNAAFGPTGTNEHIVPITGLIPDTRYYYSIGSSGQRLARGTNYWFRTSPVPGTRKPTRLWVVGDCGTGNQNAEAVRNAYYNFAASSGPADFWLMLGDNAYNSGMDTEYQTAVFDMYPATLRNLFLWPTIGNHESAQSFTAADFPYLHIFTLPQQGEAGGVPSGSPRYYSFDYANIHFICLDSMTSGRTTNTAMAQWLIGDLNASTAEWNIVFFHHPPYTRGNHNSDFETELIEMRQNILPILESHGVDLVLNGHSHDWERSYLLHGHYGVSSTLTPAMKIDPGNGRVDGTGAYQKNALGQGVVYTVAGNAGQTTGGQLNHPAHFISLNELGSIIIDVVSNRLDAMLLGPNGVSHDHFTLRKRNLPPVVQNGVVTVDEDGSAAITLVGSDPDGSAVAYTIISAPTNGTLRVVDGGIASIVSVTDGSSLGSVSNLVYTPNPNFHGADRLTFRVSDGSLDSGVGTIAITVVSVNDSPVADASATPQRSIIAANNRDAIAVLDGSRSSDADNDLLRFLWTEESIPLATGMVAMVTLPVGLHDIILQVSDGISAKTDSVTIAVISGTHTVQELIDMLISSTLSRKSLPPLLATLNAAGDAVQRGSGIAAINQLHAFRNKVRAQIEPSDPALGAQLINLAQRIIDSIDPAPRPKLAIEASNNRHAAQLKFTGNGARAYVIESSSDMIHWEAIGTARDRGNGQFEFDDDRIADCCRFYRVKVL